MLGGLAVIKIGPHTQSQYFPISFKYGKILTSEINGNFSVNVFYK